MRGKLLDRVQLTAIRGENLWLGGAPSVCAGQAYGWSGAGPGFKTDVWVDDDGTRVAVLLLTARHYDTAQAAARTASLEPVARRLWHRLPWLGLGLLGAMASAVVVGRFEDEIRYEVLLAFFVPAVVYMADAVGTQTETVVIRGLALGIPIASVFARELLTGLVIGALLGSAFFAFVLAIWCEADVASAVGISLAISCPIASLVAMALPYGLARLGRDPAFGSGPLATVIQDLLSIVAYFAVALLLVD